MNNFSFPGTVKVWTLNGQEDKSSQILENESKQIRCLNALSLTCCVYNMRTVLIVCNTYWNVYDAGDFTCLLSVPCQRGERWLGGEFISGDKLCCWSDSGDAYLYKLPTNCIVESKDFHNRSREGQAGRVKQIIILLVVINHQTLMWDIVYHRSSRKIALPLFLIHNFHSVKSRPLQQTSFY